MKIIYTIVFSLLISVNLLAQYRYENFNNGIPANWTSSSENALSINSEHFKDGDKSLKWNAQNGDIITVKNLRIPKEEIIGAKASSEIFVYSKEPSLDTLVFQFFDKEGKLCRQGRMLLNYAGWREYHRSLQLDYDKGINLSEFMLDECRIVYKAGKGNIGTVVYLDAVRFVGNKETRRQAAPHSIIDKDQFKKIGLAGGDPIDSWLNKPSIKSKPVSPTEAKDIQKIRAIYKRPLSPVKKSDLTEAMKYVEYSNISRNSDNSIKGKGILAISDPDTLVKVSTYCGILARSFLLDNNKEAKDALILFTEYLIDQGIAEGGRNVFPTNTYGPTRSFPLGFMDALAVYPPKMRAQVLAMLKWSHEYNKIYADTFVPGLNTDYVHLKTNIIFELALANPDEADVARDLKYLSRFLEQNTVIGQGGQDGIKPDGVGFHHHTHHISYLFAYGTWIQRAYSLKGTSFKISKLAYENMRFALKTLLLETSKGTIYPHALSGRKPFPHSIPVKSESIVKFIEVGEDIPGIGFDKDMAAFYNYIYQVNKYKVEKADLDGFYQFNYGQLGLLRKDNWVVAMRGFTDRMFGAEIYAGQNRYGRYQSYGSLEILYNGSLEETGYIAYGKGWDWNVMPGTTTVHLPWSQLKAKPPTATEFQKESFAGALSLGKNGIFGFDFVQDSTRKYQTNNLTFRKSVFAFDDILICLGSKINATGESGPLATNLFQNVWKEGNPSIVIESKNVSEDSFNTELSVKESGKWIINGVNTGYYLLKGNSPVIITRGIQETPDYTSNDGKKLRRANASKAWINHGKSPVNAQYQLVVVPNTNAKDMKTRVSGFENNSIYTILKHTNSIHAVKHIPSNLISYVFFEALSNINIGYVKSISSPALLGIEDKGDSIIVTINDPDLNTVPNTETFWESSKKEVKLEIKGKWTVLSSKSKVKVDAKDQHTVITFSLIHGFSNEVVLKK